MAKWLPIFSLALSLLAAEQAVSAGMSSNGYVLPCKIDSKNLNQCIINAWKAIKPKLGKGIPKLKIPPLEPFSLPEITIDRRSEILDVNGTMKQLAISGVTNVIISKLNVDPKDLSGSVSLVFAELNVTTSYAMDAMLMKTVPMKGQGQFKGTINDVRMNLTGKAVRSPKDKLGHSHLKLVEVNCKGFIGDAKGQIVNNSENSEINNFAESANKFYEKNKREVLDMLTPIVEESCESHVILGGANRVLAAMPVEEMFIGGANRVLSSVPVEEMFIG